MADSSKTSAYGTKAADSSFRRTWDKEEYREKAREKDKDEKERMKANEELMRKGKKPKKHHKEDLPKPTELMKQREGSLELDKNLGKTMVVANPGGRGPGQPGFYCEVCSRTCKDSIGYLDHINSRQHLRRLGQTTKIERSTVEQVRARIATLRQQTKDAANAKTFDFDQRLAEIKAKEDAVRLKQKEERKAQKEAALRVELEKDEATKLEEDQMMKMMGFSGFSAKNK